MYIYNYITYMYITISTYSITELCCQCSCNRHFGKISRIPKDSKHHFGLTMYVLLQIPFSFWINETLLQGCSAV